MKNSIFFLCLVFMASCQRSNTRQATTQNIGCDTAAILQGMQETDTCEGIYCSDAPCRKEVVKRHCIPSDRFQKCRDNYNPSQTPLVQTGEQITVLLNSIPAGADCMDYNLALTTAISSGNSPIQIAISNGSATPPQGHFQITYSIPFIQGLFEYLPAASIDSVYFYKAIKYDAERTFDIMLKVVYLKEGGEQVTYYFDLSEGVPFIGC